MLQTLLLIEAPITPAEILSMVNMDTTLSSVLGNTQQQLPRYCLPVPSLHSPNTQVQS